MSALPPTQSGKGFLSFNSMPPRLWITADGDSFDEVIFQYWREEGYDVTYLPYSGGGQAYKDALKTLHLDLELGETYALVAYGEAASVCLKTAIKPMPKLCALAAYYPTIPLPPKTVYPPLLQVVVHMTTSQPMKPAFKHYEYEARPGFAEHNNVNYNAVEAGLAWSRTLGCVRKGFRREADLEEPWVENLKGKYNSDRTREDEGALATIKTMINTVPHVTHVPTLTGGIGMKDLRDFYRAYFIPSLVPDFKIRLISRTMGVDRVADEMVVSFTHTDEIDWILPGVPPTDKKVEIAMVSIVGVRGGKLTHEHVYWDQASVLVQVGLLDPKIMPGARNTQGLANLPVVGVESARQILDVKKERYNKLLAGLQ